MARSALKRRFSSGQLRLGALLMGNCPEDDERAALGMTVGALLEASPETRNRMAAVAQHANVGLHLRLRELTTAERRRLTVACDWAEIEDRP